MFQAGAQDLQHAPGPLPVPPDGDFPDLPAGSWFDYAATEGVPHALDLNGGYRRRAGIYGPSANLRS